jgi:hypothetical protein
LVEGGDYRAYEQMSRRKMNTCGVFLREENEEEQRIKRGVRKSFSNIDPYHKGG